MADETVLRRKIGDGAALGPGPAAAGAAAGAAGPALGLALARAARRLMALPVEVAGAAESLARPGDLAEDADAGGLLVMLEPAGQGAGAPPAAGDPAPGAMPGLAALSAATVAAVVEMQLTGRLAAQAPPARRPTRIDAVLTAELIDAALAGLAAAMGPDGAAQWGQGQRFGYRLDDPRPLALLLEAPRYRVLRVELRIGPRETARAGSLMIALPDAVAASARPRGTAPRSSPGQADGTGWSTALRRVVADAPAELEAVLARVQLPLATVMGLRPGSEIRLPPDALAQVRLEAMDGRQVCPARLGQAQGLRALRLAGEFAAPGDAPALAERPGQASDPVAEQPSAAPATSPAPPAPAIARPVPARAATAA